MVTKLYKLCLVILEKLDAKDTFIKRLSYKATRKVYDKLFWYIYSDSPYNYNRWYSDDI